MNLKKELKDILDHFRLDNKNELEILSIKLAELFKVIDHLKDAEGENSQKINQLVQDTSLSPKLDELFKVVVHLKEANGTNSQTINQNSSLSLKLVELLKVTW